LRAPIDVDMGRCISFAHTGHTDQGADQSDNDSLQKFEAHGDHSSADQSLSIGGLNSSRRSRVGCSQGVIDTRKDIDNAITNDSTVWPDSGVSG